MNDLAKDAPGDKAGKPCAGLKKSLLECMFKSNCMTQVSSWIVFMSFSGITSIE